MPAIRVDIPAGIAGPVWLAHVVRVALVAAATGEAPANTPSLRVEVGDNVESSGTTAQTLSTPPHGKHAPSSAEP